MPEKSKSPSQAGAPSAPSASPAASATELTAAVTRARRLMLISGLTSVAAIAAVIGVIGYKLYTSGRSGSATIVNGTVFLPQGARVTSTTVSGDRIVATLDVGGNSEVRIYDLKTLQQIGQFRFAIRH